MGCGSPSPDAPVSGHTTGSAEAIRSAPAGDAPRTSPGANASARQAPTQTSPLGPTAQQASIPGALITDASRATSPAPDARIQTPASPTGTQQPDGRADAEQAQREARQSWYAEVGEHPDSTGRLQALELWAEQLDDGIDPVTLTYALVDQDDHEWAQELWEEQFIQEVEADAP
jgi:hypothetical protein